MEPAYHHLQFVLVDRVPRKYSRGEVIVFRKEKIGQLIKRIVAVPGDSVQIVDGRLWVNGKSLPLADQIAFTGLAEEELTLNDHQFFVLGDNVNHSIDSRSAEVGNVTENEILGRVIFPASDRSLPYLS